MVAVIFTTNRKQERKEPGNVLSVSQSSRAKTSAKMIRDEKNNVDEISGFMLILS